MSKALLIYNINSGYSKSMVKLFLYTASFLGPFPHYFILQLRLSAENVRAVRDCAVRCGRNRELPPYHQRHGVADTMKSGGYVWN